MSQLTLGFDAPANISRKSDPITSQKSAAETERRINTLQWFVLQAIRNALKPITANEAAHEAAKEYVANIETFRKRVRELVRLDLVVECEDRKCEVTGKSAMTFRAKEQT
jgi:ATP-dependent RNA circularization protein (DNA/RNA ligase family)